MNSLILISGAPWATTQFRDAGFATLSVEPTVQRVLQVADLLETHPAFCDYVVGCFGADEGAAALLDAAAQRPWGIGALVLLDARRGDVEHVRVPTLFELRREDPAVMKLARRAYARLLEHCELAAPKDDADAVKLACAWFGRHLGAAQAEQLVPNPPATAH
ncbi:MAG: hypothetical protein IPJ65_39630 [Archangiaceae bacterium]|nr:hypothetical protein [Archangiaceae bacterium]